MRTLILLVITTLSTGILSAQSQFERRVKEIKDQITVIKSEETAKLESEVAAINQKLERKEVNAEDAAVMKGAKAQECADRIESRVAPLQSELNQLIKDEIEADTKSENKEEDIKSEIESGLADIKISIKDKKRKSDKGLKSENRTTSQFVFAAGLNNALSDGNLSNNGFKAATSRFYEWGITWKTRLIESSPLLNLKYGLSLSYNNLRPDNNTYFVKSGNQTVLETYPKDLYNEPYFRRVNLVLPVHLEFDFSKKIRKDDQVAIKTQKGFRIGFGGFVGLNTSSKQILEYKEDKLRNRIESKGNYNTNDFVYGASGYIGYRNVSLYSKYDFNTIFKDNTTDLNNISFGLRFDFQ